METVFGDFDRLGAQYPIQRGLIEDVDAERCHDLIYQLTMGLESSTGKPSVSEDGVRGRIRRMLSIIHRLIRSFWM